MSLAWFAILGGPQLQVLPTPASASATGIGYATSTTIAAAPAAAPAAAVGVTPIAGSSGLVKPTAATGAGVGVAVTITVNTLPLVAPASGVGTAAVAGAAIAPDTALASAAGTAAVPGVGTFPALAPAAGVGVSPPSAGHGYAYPAIASATGAGTYATPQVNVVPLAAPATGVGVNPVSGPPLSEQVNVVIQSSGSVGSITQAQWNTMAEWGVGSIIVTTNFPPGFGGNALYSTFPTLSTLAAGWKADAVLAHNAGVQVLLEFSIENYEFTPSSGSYAVYTSNPAPCLGSWNPAFVDGNGNGWGGTTVPYAAGSWNLMMYQAGYAIYEMGLDGMFWDTEGGEIGPQHYVTVTNCTWTEGSTTVTTTSSFAGLSGGNDINVPGGGSVLSVQSNTSLTMNGAATSSGTGSVIFDTGASYLAWGWWNFYNEYGNPHVTGLPGGEVPGNPASFQRYQSNQAQEQAWAQTAGFNMMTALNRGYQAAGGTGDVPVYLYASDGFHAHFPGGYADLNRTYQGQTITQYVGGTGNTPFSYHNWLVGSTWPYFIVGCAQASTAPIVCGDSYFYSCSAVINDTNLYYSDSDGGWARALAADQAGLVGLATYTGITTPSNLYIAPDLWILDSTGGNSPGGPTWTQAQWNQALGPILSAVRTSGADAYVMYDQTGFPNAITSSSNYADNTNASRGGTGQNYTPLGGTVGPQITHIQNSPASTVNSGTTITLTLPNLPTAGNYLTVVTGGGGLGPGPPAFTVSGGGVGTWSYIADSNATSATMIAYGIVTGTPSETITVSVVTGNISQGQQSVASEWSGIVGVDTSESATGTSASAAPGSLTPTVSGDLFLVTYGNTGSFTGTASGWTMLGAIDHSGIAAWYVNNSTTALNPAAPINASNAWVATMVAFKSSGVGAPIVQATAGTDQIELTWE